MKIFGISSRRPLALSLVLAILWGARPAEPSVIAGPIVNPANGHTYYLLSQNDWTGSAAEASTLSGNLVTINNQAENDWVFDTFATFGGIDRALWVGYSDQANEGSFVWSSGQDPGVTIWSTGQPDNGFPGPDPPGEDFVHMLWPNHGNEPAWNDFQDLPTVNTFPLHGVVEVEPPIFEDGFEQGDTSAWSNTSP